MKRYFLLSLLIVQIGISKAQIVGLDKSQISQLKVLIVTDSIASKLYKGFCLKAKKALLENPNPRDTIVSQGHLKTDPDKIASELSMQDFNKIYALELVYKMGQERAYLDKAVDYLMAWARINHPLGHPINDTKLDRVLEAYDMLRTELKEEERQLVDDWLIRIADNEIKKISKGKPSAMSNWHSHRLKVVGEIGYILGNQTYITYATEGLPIQIDTNLNADGTSFDFLERDALHYHAYDIEPMLCLSIILKKASDTDYFNYRSPKAASLKNSVEWFLPFLTGEKTHAEFVNTKVQFDIARAKNNESAFTIGKNFKPEHGLYTLALASYFDKKYLTLYYSIRQKENNVTDWQMVVNQLLNSHFTNRIR